MPEDVAVYNLHKVRARGRFRQVHFAIECEHIEHVVVRQGNVLRRARRQIAFTSSRATRRPGPRIWDMRIVTNCDRALPPCGP